MKNVIFIIKGRRCGGIKIYRCEEFKCKVPDDRSSSSEEEDSDDKDVDTKKATGGSTLPNKERRDLLGNTPQQPQEPIHYNLSGVTHRPLDQTTSKIESSTATPATTERIGFLGPIQSLFP
ncbi:uncharacterized protein isoform X2 [Rhodnius prolixus]|uniref:uncharacterized protein isoform X2 n=1 Tax=Rhodnius prolixus TaxID=13249 RepID=UPI003D18D34D